MNGDGVECNLFPNDRKPLHSHVQNKRKSIHVSMLNHINITYILGKCNRNTKMTHSVYRHLTNLMSVNLINQKIYTLKQLSYQTQLVDCKLDVLKNKHGSFTHVMVKFYNNYTKKNVSSSQSGRHSAPEIRIKFAPTDTRSVRREVDINSKLSRIHTNVCFTFTGAYRVQDIVEIG